MEAPKNFKSKSELANEYGIHRNTLRSWLVLCKFYEVHPEAHSAKLLSPVHILYIYSKLGEP